MPGVLKNAIDHASRPCGQSAWTGKPAGEIGADSKAFLQGWMNQYVAWVKKHAA